MSQTTCLPVSLVMLLLLTFTASSAVVAEDNSLLLVADPDMRGPVFQRSVVLVTPHGNGAALGVILNHPIPIEALEQFPDQDLQRDMGVIYFGGPVHPEALVFLFRAQERPDNALHLFADVYFSQDHELLAAQLRRSREESALQVYVGYAGWARGQLQAEIYHGAWRTQRVTLELLFETDRDTIWEKLSGEQAEKWI